MYSITKPDWLYLCLLIPLALQVTEAAEQEKLEEVLIETRRGNAQLEVTILGIEKQTEDIREVTREMRRETEHLDRWAAQVKKLRKTARRRKKLFLIGISIGVPFGVIVGFF